jgi:hypothetical protein
LALQQQHIIELSRLTDIRSLKYYGPGKSTVQPQDLLDRIEFLDEARPNADSQYLGGTPPTLGGRPTLDLDSPHDIRGPGGHQGGTRFGAGRRLNDCFSTSFLPQGNHAKAKKIRNLRE